MAQRAAIVAGGSSGIGLGIARVLGEEGYGLTVAARRPEKLEEAVEGVRADGFDVNAVSGNLGDEAVVQEVVRSHRDRFGRLDGLVNNAGVGAGEAVSDLTTKKVDLQLAINLRSPILFYRECVELLRAAGAEHRCALVVNTSSIWASQGRRGCRSTARRRRRSSASRRRCTRSSPAPASSRPRCARPSSTRR
jgi:NAD(P)-dependent dehydrogenase (short-subunit alcohol dehydrogenase family)